METIEQKVARLDSFLERARNERLVGMSVCLPSPAVPEIIGVHGLDFIILDTEHTSIHGAGMLTELSRSAELAGVPYFLKANGTDPLEVRDATDAGAYGAIVPFIESVGQFTDFVDAVRYPPVGSRGICSLSRACQYFAYLYTEDYDLVTRHIDFINDRMLVIPSIESIEGVEALDEILSVPDTVVVHIGHTDLMLSLRREGRDRKYTHAVVRNVSKRIRAAGKLVLYADSLTKDHSEHAEGLDYLGADLLYVADLMALSLGIREAAALAAACRTKREPKADNVAAVPDHLKF